MGGKNLTVKVNGKTFEIDKQRKKPGNGKLCPSKRNFPPHPNPSKKYSPVGRILFYQSEYETVYVKFPKSICFSAKEHGNRINSGHTDLVLNVFLVLTIHFPFGSLSHVIWKR